MNRIVTLLLLCVFVSAAFASTPDLARSRSNPNGIPLWVAAEKAIDAQGEIRREYFYGDQVEDLESMRKANAGRADCHASAKLHFETHRKSSSVDELAASSLTIARGSVVDAHPGFYVGVPATLLEVRLTESIKRLGLLKGSDTDTVYLVIAEARIQTARGLICGTSYMGVTIPTPKPGDDILFFAFHEPADEDLSIYEADLRNQVVVQRDGRVHAPASLEEFDGIETLDRLVRVVGRSPKLNHFPGHEVY